MSSCKAGSALGSDPAQSFIQWGLETLKACRWHKHPGKPVPPLGRPQGKTAFPYIPCAPLFHLKPVVPCLPAVHHCEEPDSIFLKTSSGMQFCPRPSLSILDPYFLFKKWSIYFAVIKITLEIQIVLLQNWLTAFSLQPKLKNYSSSSNQAQPSITLFSLVLSITLIIILYL